jgi:hypothetical protein
MIHRWIVWHLVSHGNSCDTCNALAIPAFAAHATLRTTTTGRGFCMPAAARHLATNDAQELGRQCGHSGFSSLRTSNSIFWLHVWQEYSYKGFGFSSLREECNLHGHVRRYQPAAVGQSF